MSDEPHGLTLRQGSEIASVELLDHDAVEWERVRRTAFLVHQYLQYDYPGPIEDLKHRLVIVPPERHGDQRRIVHHFEVSLPAAQVADRKDAFGNWVLEIAVPRVERSIGFEAWIVVERGGSDAPHRLKSARSRARFLAASPLTKPDDALREIAASFAAERHEPADLAARVNDWVYRTMTYQHDVTDIHTAAAEALALRRGVCQDFAHIMLALCRLCGLPARYVSGHLLGEGGTHAWVEVLIPGDRPGTSIVLPFDPTHGRQAGLSYVTVAVGRDYADVAPTSGTYRASYRGELSGRKRVGLTAVEYERAG